MLNALAMVPWVEGGCPTTRPGARQGNDEILGCGDRESMSRGVLNTMDVGGSEECVSRAADVLDTTRVAIWD